MNPVEIHKVLSANDVGLTGGHQSGILVPKSIIKTDFFPALPKEIANPRTRVALSDAGEDIELVATLIYYNGREMGHSTRSEFRLTGIASYLKKLNAKVGDTLVFKSTNNPRSFAVTLHHQGSNIQVSEDVVRISLSGNWTTLKQGKR